MLTQSSLKAALRYDPATGHFFWVACSRAYLVGRRAGTVESKGARQIGLNRALYLEHRLAWLYMTGEWPTTDIDHKDGNPANNSWSNLRAATESQNKANSKRPKNNTSGAKGVYQERSTGRWNAYVRVNGKGHYLGTFDTVEEASLAYQRGALLHFGEFARAA